MIRVPGDKSISHRALLLAALAEGESRLRGVLAGGDCRSTAACLRALGVDLPKIPSDGGEMVVPGRGMAALRTPAGPLDCGNSGTTARLLLGVLAGLPLEAVLTGDASLRARPMRRVTGPLAGAGASYLGEGDGDRLPLRSTGGALRPISWVSPVASAQVKSALLLAGVTGGVAVEVTEPERSRDHTERMLRRCGIPVEEGASGEGGWRVAIHGAGTRVEPFALEVPGDFSSAAFLIALAVMGGSGPALRIRDVGLNPTRTGLLAVLARMGADVEVEDARELGDPAGEPAGTLRAGPGALSATTVHAPEIPALIDEIPLIAVLAARADGRTVIHGAAELRVKESDRIATLASNLRTLGVHVEEHPDGLTIDGSDRRLQGRVRSHHDHRIAMAFGVLGALPGNRIEIDDPGAADVSFPGFWQLLASLRREGGRRAALPDRPGRSAALVVTIDGPAGSGKSTTARAVADALGLRHLDSGALYRAATLALLRAGTPEEAWDAVTMQQLRDLDIRLEPREGGFAVLIAGEDPGEALRGPDVTGRVSRAARIPAVRAWLLETQRAAAERGVVTDGRDMGTVVFPSADVKIFLSADVDERARRRILQEGGTPDAEAIREEAERIRLRDELDAKREIAPLRPADDAVHLDTTGVDFEEQVSRIVGLVRARLFREGAAAAPSHPRG